MDFNSGKPLKQAGAIPFKNLPRASGYKLNPARRVAVPMYEGYGSFAPRKCKSTYGSGWAAANHRDICFPSTD
jgi:hypothetical protein